MRPPETLQSMAINFFWRRPALWRSQHDHRPASTLHLALLACHSLIFFDLVDAVFRGSRHRLVHAYRIGTFHKLRRPSIATEKALQFLVADSSKERRVIDFVTIQMQDRQDGSIARGIEELVDMP